MVIIKDNNTITLFGNLKVRDKFRHTNGQLYVKIPEIKWKSYKRNATYLGDENRFDILTFILDCVEIVKVTS